jgi:hypothetical protein
MARFVAVSFPYVEAKELVTSFQGGSVDAAGRAGRVRHVLQRAAAADRSGR